MTYVINELLNVKYNFASVPELDLVDIVLVLLSQYVVISYFYFYFYFIFWCTHVRVSYTVARGSAIF